MSQFILSTDSTADLSMEYFQRRSVDVQFFHFTLGVNEYQDDCGKSVPPKELFRRMVAGEETKTSQVSVSEYLTYFREMMEQGHDVLHLGFSSGLSGSYNAARLAAEELRPQFPDRKLYVVDTLAASSGQGLFVDTVADLRDAGMDIDTIYAWANENRNMLHHWFFSTDLTFYIRGGRVSRTAGFFGGLLGICPLLNVNNEGKLIPREKVRGKKKVIKRIVEMMQVHAQNGADYSGRCFISNSDCIEDAQAVARLVEEAFPKLNGKVQIYSIGATIGSHTGPGTVALFFWGDERPA